MDMKKLVAKAMAATAAKKPTTLTKKIVRAKKPAAGSAELKKAFDVFLPKDPVGRAPAKKSATLAEKKAAIPRSKTIGVKVVDQLKVPNKAYGLKAAEAKSMTAAFPEVQNSDGSIAKLIKMLQAAPRGAQFRTTSTTLEIYNSKGRRIGGINRK